MSNVVFPTQKQIPTEQAVLTNFRQPDVVEFHDTINKWLSDPKESFFKLSNNVRLSEYNLYNSKKTEPTENVPGKIILIQQFFIPKDKSRLNELQQTLKCNCHNESIDKIVLLNEQIYTNEELGTADTKIEQINISKRLTYKDVFEYSNKLEEDTYIVLANTDIFFDASIKSDNSGKWIKVN